MLKWKAEADGEDFFRPTADPVFARTSSRLRLAGAVITVTLFVVTLLAWQSLRQRETQMLEGQVAVEAGALARRFEAALHERISAIERMARRWEVAGGTPKAVWEFDAQSYLETLSGGFFGIRWADAAGGVRWVAPITAYTEIVGRNLFADPEREVLLTRARLVGRPVFGYVDHPRGGRALLLVRALNVAGRPDGYLLAGFRTAELAAALSAESIERGYGVALTCGHNLVYRSAEPPADAPGYETVFSSGGCDWRFRLWPTPQKLAEEESALPGLVLASGSVLALLVGLLFWLWNKSRWRANEAMAARSQAITAHHMLQTILDTAPMCIFWKDRQLKYLGCNLPFALDAGRDRPEALIGCDDFDLRWRDRALDYRHDDMAVIESGRPRLHYEEVLANGVWVRTSKVPLRDPDGTIYGVLGMYEDIADEKAAELQQRLAATVFENSQEGITITDARGNIIAVNRAFSAITGYATEEVLGSNPRLLQSGMHDQAFYLAMWETLRREGHWRGDIWNRRKNGEIYPEILSITAVHDDHGQPLHYIAVFTDISERKVMEESLRLAKDAAEAASQAKSEFLASMSHELRTPLNAILGFSQLFALDPALSQESREHAGEIERAGNHLLALINDLIDLSRIEAGKLTLSLEAVPVWPVLQESLQMVAGMARERGITLCDLDGADENTVVSADYVRLRQVLINLLTNAIKYNSPDGEVRLSCSSAEEGIRITVSDTGGGIPVDKQARIFTMFDRLGAERGKVEGTGIGLVITRRLVEAMGGSIGFESREGEGSRFWLIFPPCLSDNHTPLHPAIAAAPASGGKVASGGRRPVVLHIEDNPMNLRLMHQVFTRRPDLELRDTHSAEIGLELIRAEPPQLILMDINLSGMDGYAALRVLQANSQTASIPVLAISANAMKGDAEHGLAAGFEAYFTKPIDVQQLLAAIAHHLPPAEETQHA